MLDGGVMQSTMQGTPTPGSDGGFTFEFSHAEGTFPVGIRVTLPGESENDLFPLGEPECGSYLTTVLPIAEGQAFIGG